MVEPTTTHIMTESFPNVLMFRYKIHTNKSTNEPETIFCSKPDNGNK